MDNSRSMLLLLTHFLLWYHHHFLDLLLTLCSRWVCRVLAWHGAVDQKSKWNKFLSKSWIAEISHPLYLHWFIVSWRVISHKIYFIACYVYEINRTGYKFPPSIRDNNISSRAHFVIAKTMEFLVPVSHPPTTCSYWVIQTQIYI